MTTDRAPSPQSGEDSKTLARSSLVSREPRSRTTNPTPARDKHSEPLVPSGFVRTDFRKRAAILAAQRTNRGPPLIYRRTPLWFALLYLITLIVPWVLICILDMRPFSTPTYYDQRGRINQLVYDRLRGVLVFVNVLRSISGIVVIPITSTILAHAVVAYAQRTSPNKKLNMAQLFALADKGWTNIAILWRSGRTKSSSRLLWLGAALTVLGGIQQPLQSALVTMVPIVMTTCNDVPYRNCHGHLESNYMIIGLDAEPWAMSRIDHSLVLEEVTNSLVTISDVVNQDDIWVDNPLAKADWVKSDREPGRRSTLSWYVPTTGGEPLRPGAGFFVSSLANGTETGVLREHALRLSSDLSCESVPRSEYPSPCPGERPVSTELETSKLKLRVCAPGEIGRSPWSMDRNRQDIEEELYLDFRADEALSHNYPEGGREPADFTTRCTATTSRGYFELGNVMNHGAYGPLIERWPDAETIENETNDWLPDFAQTQPEEVDHGPDDALSDFGKPALNPYGLMDMVASGPLMTSAAALFGNTSFLNILRDNETSLSTEQTLHVMCEQGRMPFAQVVDATTPDDRWRSNCYGVARGAGEDDAETRLDEIVNAWMVRFEEVAHAEFLLLISAFVANRAVLSQAVAGASLGRAREIYHSPGTPLSKPTKGLASTAVISAAILLQALGLGAMVWYINRVPTWASGLDAMALARIGKEMRDGDVPPLGAVSESDQDGLRTVDALVGIKDDDIEDGGASALGWAEERNNPEPNRPLIRKEGPEIRLGAKGLITRDVRRGKTRRNRGPDSRV